MEALESQDKDTFKRLKQKSLDGELDGSENEFLNQDYPLEKLIQVCIFLWPSAYVNIN